MGDLDSGLRDGTRTFLLFVLILSYAQFAVLLNSVGTVILQAINGFGVGKAQAATLEAFKDLPIALVSLTLAAWLPRFGLRRALILGHAIVGLACAAMALRPGFDMARLLFLATGVGFALVKTATYTIVGLLSDRPSGHAVLTNRIEGCFMLGVLAGYWVFGAFIDQAHPGDPIWVRVYWLLAAVSVTVVVLLVFTHLDEREARSPETASWRAMTSLFAFAPVFSFGGAAFLYVLVEQGVGTWLPTFNAEVLKLSAPMSVQAASIFAAALALGRLAAAPVIARIGWRRLLILCIAGIAAVVLGLLPLGHGHAMTHADRWLDVPWYGYAAPALGFFLAPIYPTIVSAILAALPRERHAAMTGLIIGFSALGGTTGSLITGRVFAALGGVAAFSLIIVPTLLLGLLAVLLDRSLHKAALSEAKDLHAPIIIN